VLLLGLSTVLPLACDVDGPCVSIAGLTVQMVYDGEAAGDAGTVQKTCAYTVTATSGDYSEELDCYDTGFACTCSGLYWRSGVYEVTVTNEDGIFVSKSIGVPDGCNTGTLWRFTFPWYTPPAPVAEALTRYCRTQAACYGETVEQCITSNTLVRQYEIERGCVAEWDAVTQCNSTYDHSCTTTYAEECVDLERDWQRCWLGECGGFGYSPPDSFPIPCAERCNGVEAECVGASEGNIHCTCTEGPKAQHEFDVYDCTEFLSRYSSECDPQTGVAPTCEKPQPLFQFEPAEAVVSSSLTTTPSGMEWCADGSYHRVEAVACIGGWERIPGCTCDGQGVDEAGTGCFDSQCYRIQGCTTNDDCSVGEVCLCSAGRGDSGYNGNACVSADCETDADCNGYECGVTDGGHCSPFMLRCHTAEDECHGNKDCPSDRHWCEFTGTRWECVESDDCE
jgi:hypothetical protein